ncbi:MAG TPA: OmpH family outer membrane protein [Anaeromyxobacteraceae bacterium]|nr:OmpH family outer membrane protein [Anaeromyxobacteraceae bacterium]
MRPTVRVLAALALAAALAPAAARAELKLGYVDLQRALNEVDEGKAAKAQLKKDFDEKQKQLDLKTDEVKKLQADFDKQAMVMSAEAKATKGAELDRKKMEVQEFYIKLQQDLSGREREVTRGIFDKMQAIAREIAEADGFTMIFERSDAGLVYAPASLDITNELIRKFNARYAGAKKAEPVKGAPAAKK